MINVEHIVQGLKEISRKAENTDQKLGLKECAERAQRACSSGNTVPIQSVMQAVLISLFTKKPRLCETALECCHHLLSHAAFKDSDVFNQILGYQGSFGGKSVVWATLEALCDTLSVTDGTVVLKTLDCISDAIIAETISIGGSILTRVLQTCFNLHLTSSNAAVQIKAGGAVKEVLIRRILKGMMKPPQSAEEKSPIMRPPQFVCRHGLDFNAELEPVEYEEMEIENVEIVRYIDTAKLFQEISPTLRDVVIVFRTFCSLGSRPLPSSANTTQHIDVRTRSFALQLILLFLEEMPHDFAFRSNFGNCEMNCFLHLVKNELLVLVGRNLASVAPGSFFTTAVKIFTQLMLKCSYFLQIEIHTFLLHVMFPIAQSRLSNMQQKLEILTMIHRVLEKPDVAIAYFLNYDCNIHFGDPAQLPGMLDPILQFVVELMCGDFSQPGWTTEDQVDLLRQECMSVLCDFSAMMFHWIHDEAPPDAEGPIPSSKSEGDGEMSEIGETARAVSAARVSNWQLDDGLYTPKELETTIAPVSHPEKKVERVSSNVSGGNINTDSDLGQSRKSSRKAWSFRGKCVGNIALPDYHWRHLHQCACNKRIILEATSRFNTNWKFGRTYMIDKKVIEDSYLELAQFIRRTPSVQRNTICNIFERVLKDQENYKLLQAYISTFHYKDVPLDVALRDTSCEFMSWEDRPQFEAQVWNCIQEIFGAEYAKQNDYCISVVDADILSGVILFLHTCLHNAKVGAGDRMTVERFIRDGTACLHVEIPKNEMEAMYYRVAERRWGPDSNLRSVVTASSPLLNDDSDFQGKVDTIDASRVEEKLLDGNMANYTNNIGNLQAVQVTQINYLRRVNQFLGEFEKAIDALRMKLYNNAKIIPYVRPFYAQHVKLMFLRFYPHLSAGAYFALRMARCAPMISLVQDFFTFVYDIASVFAINLSEHYSATEKMIRWCLRQKHASPLGGPTSSIAIFLAQKV